MGTEVPKQFLLLAGRPVLMHSISAFRLADPAGLLIVVLPEDQQDMWKSLCEKHQFHEPHILVAGGQTRYHSVKNGLALLQGEGLVAVHDGVRPLISPEMIRHLYSVAAVHSNAIPVISPKDSLRWDDEHGNRVIDRNHVKIIQTPQVFELNKLKAAYVQDYEDAFTDDATVWGKAGNPVHLTEGDPINLKITTPADLIVAEAFAGRENAPKSFRG